MYSRTTKKLLIPLLLMSVVVTACTSIKTPQPTSLTSTMTSEETAVKTIQNRYTELQDYPSDTLAPRSISTQQDASGWYVAFIQEGSGRPIISARCFFVDENNNVTNNGEYIPSLADDSVEKFLAKTCAPIVPPSTPPSAIEPPPTACTMEAKVCPDGSAVGRSWPNCEFTPCPGEVSSTCSCPGWYRQEGQACTPECYYSTPKCLMPSIQCQ